MERVIIAAVDLGSNSFRLEIGRVEGEQIYTLDSLKEPVRIAAGLTPQKTLDAASQLRALEALSRFGERLRGFDPGAVRAVATNTFRVAKNASQFLRQAEDALGFPIEIIAGREEARLIYLGVAQVLPDRQARKLVVDIGGGSTEFIIGQGFEPIELESLYMGCVSFSLRYFPDGRIDKNGMKEAELAARKELQAIARRYRETGWEAAVGSSGTARAVADVVEQNGLAERGITLDALEAVKQMLIRAGDLGRLQLPGLRADRIPVLPGGVAILAAVFKELGLEEMNYAEGALRLGVLYDLIGRYHHHDMRDATVAQFLRRYGVDRSQAQRVEEAAIRIFRQLRPDAEDEDDDLRFLRWAARLHEIGISVAHASYHKHSAYILANADMPGFSRRDQARLARLALGHRGKLERAQALQPESGDRVLLFCLRLAAILNRARTDDPFPPLQARQSSGGFHFVVQRDWLDNSPLSAAALEEEIRQWASVGVVLRVKPTSA